MERLHHYFETQAVAHPHHVALICSDAVVSYEDLEHRANRWSHLLQSYELDAGKIAGIFLPRIVDLYAGILGILKTGAAYLPFDPNFPAERIEYMVTDSQAAVLITSKIFVEKLTKLTCPILYIEDLQTQLVQQPITRTLVEQENNHDCCYVIYTSGSTGQPKGVAVNHGNVCSYINAALQIYGIKANDRIYQGFSLAFDASIEEIWMAFASGAALVVGASDAVHAGAELVEFLNFHRVTIFSTIPTLLAMLDGEIKNLRLLIVGAEVCPPELIKRWTRSGLRILNTYGPTEATIVSTYHECHVNELITIGKPFPNCQIYILDEKLQAVKQGTTGELFIGGPNVATGYLNKPELTAKKFINHPENKSLRLYRTGDLVYQTPQGEIQFVGRADEQVKLRGYRIELSEIQTVILENEEIRHAAVALQELTPGVPSLVAYLVLRNKDNIDPEKLTQQLRAKLPDYMVPTLFEIIKELPLLPSGKIDRKNLPLPKMHSDKISNDYVAPRTSIEKKIIAIWEDLFKHQPISIKADFFHELGGHSLFAAKAVSLLRKEPEMASISMVDIYENHTVERLAQKFKTINVVMMGENSNDDTQQKENNATVKWRYRLCAIGQALGSYLRFGLVSWQFLAIYLILTFVLGPHSVFSRQFFLTGLGILLALYPILFAIAILSKWLLIGKIKPGNYPLWGWYYLRWWLAVQIQKIATVKYISGSPLMNLYCRLMGMKVGKNCHIGSEYINAFDVINIGDNSSIGNSSMVFGYTVEQGYLKIGTINIGKHCFVGVRSSLGINTVLENGAKLEDLSMLPANASIAAGQTYSGSPARLVAEKNNNPDLLQNKKIVPTNIMQEIFYGIIHYFSLMLVLAVYCVAIIPAVVLIEYYYDYHNSLLLALIVGAPLGSIAFILLLSGGIALTKKIVLGKLQAGEYPLKSMAYVRTWLVDRFFAENSSIEALYGTIYFPFWLRLLGAKVGKRAEVSAISHISSDLLTIEDESFIADLSLLGAPRVHLGYAIFAATKIGKRTFIGNNALVPPNSVLGDGCLIGCLSIPPVSGDAAKPNTSWLGSPAIFLPKREVFAGFSEKETYLPPKRLYLLRGIVDFLKITLPFIFMFAGLALLFLVVDFLMNHFSLLITILLFPLFDFFVVIAMALSAILLKWIIKGRYQETVKPAWSFFVWSSELVTCLYDKVLVDNILETFLGTPFMSVFMRMLGMKVGKRVFFDTQIFTEFDLVEIGNDVALNALCSPQPHLFEDRVIKMSKLKIGDGCAIGSGSIVLYNTIMETNSSLGSLSLLMKGEILPHDSHWAGIPAQYTSPTFPTISLVPQTSEVIDSAYVAPR